MTIVTEENVYVGMKVVRGRDWQWADQDKDSPYGVITRIRSDKWVCVNWENPNNRQHHEYIYRVGSDLCYDLYMYESSVPKFKVGNFVTVIDTQDEKCVYNKDKGYFNRSYRLEGSSFIIEEIISQSGEFYYRPENYQTVFYRENCLSLRQLKNNSITTKTQTNVPKVQRTVKSVGVSKRPTGVGIQSGRSKATISSRPISYQERACKS